MKVLLSAYACEPDVGSEPELGFAAMLAAAREHEVWVLTQPRMVAPTQAYLEQAGLSDRVHLCPVEPDAPANQSGLKALALTHLSHERWQRRAATAAARLHDEVAFEVVHHCTLGAYWMPCGVATLPVPLVWGPVAGGVVTPVVLLPELGVSGFVEEVIRRVVRRAFVFRPSIRALPSRAAVTFASNPETARQLRGHDHTVLSNVLLASTPSAVPERPARGADIVMVGRLDAWKATSLGLKALARVTAPGTRLRIFGQGRELRRLKALAASLGIADRVTFEGRVPRASVLAAVASAGAVLHCALHEEGGISVAETLALGTPLVAVSRGGPALLPAYWPDTWAELVRPAPAPLLARRLAAALQRALASGAPVRESARPAEADFVSSLLDAYATAARVGHPDS